MPQKIDIHGLFIDPETITDLLLEKRISISYPVFYEVAPKKTLRGLFTASSGHILRFDHHENYGIILSDGEQPDPASYVVNYQQAVFDQLFRSIGNAGKNITGHIAELLKIEISGDRQYRILQSGRNVKLTSIREIPAKVRLLSGQWVDVFKSSPDYDFQGGTPYAVTDVGAATLTITTQDKIVKLYGADVDAANEDVLSSYQTLVRVYNEIQEKRDLKVAEEAKKPAVQLPQIHIQLPKVELPKIDLPKIKLQSPFVFSKEKKNALPESDSDVAAQDDGNNGKD